MADVMSPPPPVSPTATNASNSHPTTKPRLPPMTLPMPIPAGRNGQLAPDLFSPVNQNGSFEFDRVLKSGHVYKRSRKTKQWKKFFLVLRSNLLSMYRNESEEKLLKQVTLSDLTAVNILKDPKGRRDHMFGLFTPSHNYHFQAGSDAEARNWVDLIRKEARIDEEEESMIFGSPPTNEHQFQNVVPEQSRTITTADRLASSSPEPFETQSPDGSTTILSPPKPILGRPRGQSFNEYDYSGQEGGGSYSDFSDAAPASLPRTNRIYTSGRTTVPIRPAPANRSASYNSTHGASGIATVPTQPSTPFQSQPQPQASTPLPPTDQPPTNSSSDQRILWQGYLLLLSSRHGVRSWKKLWTVLRPNNIAFYKNDEEYSTYLLLSISSILSAVEIDPLSRSKKFCMQIIAEERSYRFALQSEEGLARCLGAVKSALFAAAGKGRERGKGVVQMPGQQPGQGVGNTAA